MTIASMTGSPRPLGNAGPWRLAWELKSVNAKGLMRGFAASVRRDRAGRARKTFAKEAAILRARASALELLEALEALVASGKARAARSPWCSRRGSKGSPR